MELFNELHGNGQTIVIITHKLPEVMAVFEGWQMLAAALAMMLAAGTLPGFYVESIAIANRGAWPMEIATAKRISREHLVVSRIHQRAAAAFAELARAI